MLSTFRTSAVIATTVAVVIIIGLLGLLIRVLMQPLLTMTRAMEDIAEGEGDLTKRLSIHNHDEFGLLGTAFNRFVERIHGSIREVSSATEQVNEVALRVISASNSSMTNSDEQSNRTNSVAAAINELGAAAQEIAGNAAQASQHASSARLLAEEGQQVVERNIAAMNRLSDLIVTSSAHIETLNSKTVNIGQILEVITSISQQGGLEERLQSLGGEWNAYTSSADTTFVIEAPARNQRKVLDLLLAVIRDTRIDANSLATAKRIMNARMAATTATCSAGSTARTSATPPATSWPPSWASNAPSAPTSTT